MTKLITKKNSTHYTRLYRQRLRDEKGLEKKEIWIRPVNFGFVSPLEKLLRDPDFSKTPLAGELLMTEQMLWTPRTLADALVKEPLFLSGRASLELLDGAEPALYLELTELGDLPVFISVTGQQILVESLLWPAEEVRDMSGFNEAVLRTHKYFPLSTISLDRTEEGDAYYMFGALSATSLLSNVVLEIETLGQNVLQAAEAYAEYLKS